MKSAYYTAVVTNAYRMALDAYAAAPDRYTYRLEWRRELESVSHREYCTGYYLDNPMENAQLSSFNGYIREKAYFATASEQSESVIPCGVEAVNADGKLYWFMQKNKVSVGDYAEMIAPGQIGRGFWIRELYDEQGNAIASAPHPSMKFLARVPFSVSAGDIMRSGDAPNGVQDKKEKSDVC